MSSEVQERIERRRRICTQQSVTQAGLAGFAYGDVFPFVARITKTAFPIPSLEVIADPSHLTAHADIKQVIVISQLLASRTGIIDTAEPNTSSDRETRLNSSHVSESR